jgi:hypothetical protein
VYNVVRSASANAEGYILASPYTFTAPADSGNVLLMEGDGHLLKHLHTPAAAMCFRRWDLNGTIRYTWIVYDPSLYIVPVINQLSCYAVIADENLNEIKRLSLLPSGDISTDKKEGIDAHDFLLLSDDHYITMSYYQKKVTNIDASLTTGAYALVLSPVIQEVNAGQVVWQWEGTNYPEFYQTSVEWNDFANVNKTQDYMHMNSMVIDPRDNNLICSFRNLDQIIKINRKTGNIMWRLGGKNSDFPLTADQVFLRQHNATLTDNNQTLLMFDNGEATVRPYSRVLEFQLDELNKKVLAFKSYDIPEPFSQYMGSVQKMGTNYFLGGGTAKYILEVNYATGEKVLELTSNLASYRTYKY